MKSRMFKIRNVSSQDASIVPDLNIYTKRQITTALPEISELRGERPTSTSLLTWLNPSWKPPDIKNNYRQLRLMICMLETEKCPLTYPKWTIKTERSVKASSKDGVPELLNLYPQRLSTIFLKTKWASIKLKSIARKTFFETLLS